MEQVNQEMAERNTGGRFRLPPGDKKGKVVAWVQMKVIWELFGDPITANRKVEDYLNRLYARKISQKQKHKK